MTLCIRSFYEGNILAWDIMVTNKSNLFLITSSEDNTVNWAYHWNLIGTNLSTLYAAIYVYLWMSFNELKKTQCSVKTHRNHPVRSGAYYRALGFHYLHHVTRKRRDWKNHQEISDKENNHISMINNQGHEQLNTITLWAYFMYL